MLSAVGNLTNHHPLHALVSTANVNLCPWPAHPPTCDQILIYSRSPHRGALERLRQYYQVPLHRALLFHMPHQMARLFYPGRAILLHKRPALHPRRLHRHPQSQPLLDLPRWRGDRQCHAVVRLQIWLCLYRTDSAVPSLISGRPLVLARYSNRHLRPPRHQLCHMQMLRRLLLLCAGLAPGST